MFSGVRGQLHYKLSLDSSQTVSVQPSRKKGISESIWSKEKLEFPKEIFPLETM